MIVRFTNDVWFGDKPSVCECSGQIESVINVAHNIRRPYWDNVRKLPWGVWYFRLASPDGKHLPFGYISVLEYVIKGIGEARKFPLLCHCKMGGHRGPTAALFAAWVLDGKRRLHYWIDEMKNHEPGFEEKPHRRVYRQDILAYCLECER